MFKIVVYSFIFIFDNTTPITITTNCNPPILRNDLSLHYVYNMKYR